MNMTQEYIPAPLPIDQDLETKVYPHRDRQSEWAGALRLYETPFNGTTILYQGWERY